MVNAGQRNQKGVTTPTYKTLTMLPILFIIFLNFSHEVSASNYGARMMGFPRFPGSQRLFIRQEHPRVSTRQVSTWQEFQRIYGNGEDNSLTGEENSSGSSSRGGSASMSCSDEERFLCEECTKSARNEVVFPLCCSKRQNMFEWCQQFMNYELKSD